MKNAVQLARHAVQLSVFILINGGIFGLTMISLTDWKDVTMPVMSCDYLRYHTPSCYFYHLQTGISVGWGSYFVYLVLPLIVFMILSFVIAKAWCGWACPIGALEDGISWVRVRLGLPRKTFRRRTVAWIRPVKYVFLILILLVAFSVVLEPLGLTMYANSANLPYCQVCPAKPVFYLFQMGIGFLPASTVIAPLSILALAVFLAGSMWVTRFWCWVCPIGGAIAPFQAITPLYIEKDDRKCTHCHACARVCPTQVHRVFEERSKDNVNDADCILCLKCVEACPEGGCLNVRFFGKRIMKSRSFGR